MDHVFEVDVDVWWMSLILGCSHVDFVADFSAVFVAA